MGQSVPSARRTGLSITAGGTVSIFQPDYQGSWVWTLEPPWYPISQKASNGLIGVGAFADFHFSKYVQIEAEGRWQRFNQFESIHEDNYLIGPRVPALHFWKANVYGKALVGFSKMTFDPASDHGTFTTTAFGGGVDIKMSRHIYVRAFDAEYQWWPKWGNSTLTPYGVSAGVGYKIF